MSAEITKKYGRDTVNEFWGFVEKLRFDSSKSDAESIRAGLLKQISPSVSGKYKSICDAFAYALYNATTDKNSPTLLYAAYDSIAQGKDHYEMCCKKTSTVVAQAEHVHALNHFGNVFPTEDDYYGRLVSQEPSYEDIEDVYDQD
jgi:hypothetical protein